MDISGVCHALFAYDIGFAVDMNAAETQITENRRRVTLGHRKRAPEVAGDPPAPLHMIQEATPIELGSCKTSPKVNAVVYEFGAVCISYTITLETSLQGLVEISDLLYDNKTLLADSRKRAQHILQSIEASVDKPALSDLVEDYAIFELKPTPQEETQEDFWVAKVDTLARVLRGEKHPLSQREQEDALKQRLSYGAGDVSFVDWYAALLVGDDMEDERALLEFGIVELLELRFLDWQLDQNLENSYDILSKQRGGMFSFSTRARGMQRIAQLQADNAMLFEGVNNPYKLLGDQYLARLYRLMAWRFHLSDWDKAIERKLGTLESIYQKLSDQGANRRLELLEWIIIILIAVEIVTLFFPGVA